MRDGLHRAEQEKARISADLASVKRELATGQKQVAQIYHQAAALANERDELRTRLAATNARLGHTQAAKIQPENTVAALREARGTAIDVVPPNVTTSATHPAPGKALTWINGVFWAAYLLFSRLPIYLGRSGCAFRASSPISTASSTERGLMTTVPGELLFTVGSDEVQADAYAKLVKLAELIRLYDSRQVLIKGIATPMETRRTTRSCRNAGPSWSSRSSSKTSTSQPTGCPPRARARRARSPPIPRHKGGARQPPRGGPDPELIPRRSTRAPAFLRTGSASGSIPHIVPRASARAGANGATLT